MDLLLPSLLLLFFAPVLWRLARRSGSRPRAGVREMGEGLRQPGILVHLAGGALLFGGAALALAGARVQRALTVQGAAGAAIILLATALLSWALRALTSWRLLPELDASHQLCTSGPYAIVRHPNYLALNLLGLGLAVWVPGPLVFVGAVAVVVGGELRARAEERALLRSYGEKYLAYMKRVRRMIPGLY